MAGGRETGSPHGCQDVRTVEDRVAASVEVSKATGHRRRPGSPRIGRPAGHCQGHTFFPRPPSAPTTFWTVARGFGNPVGHPGVSRGVCSLSGEVTLERR
jgi:hypothetical protein